MFPSYISSFKLYKFSQLLFLFLKLLSARKFHDRNLYKKTMKPQRKKTTIEERIGKCQICHSTALMHRHHILSFSKYGEIDNSSCWILCANCHGILHVGINAIIFHKKRATEVWNNFVSTIGKDNQLIKDIENKIYETAEFGLDYHISNSDI